MYKVKDILKVSIPLLTFLIWIEILGGWILESGFATMGSILLIFPVINGVGGNIGSILGARLSSGFHSGSIQLSMSNRELRKNLFNSILLGAITFMVISLLVGLMENSLLIFILVFFSGILITLFIIGITLISTFFSARHGLDPDDIVIPVITSFGDLFGIAIILNIWKFIMI